MCWSLFLKIQSTFDHTSPHPPILCNRHKEWQYHLSNYDVLYGEVFLQAPWSTMRTGHKMSQRIHPKVPQYPFLNSGSTLHDHTSTGAILLVLIKYSSRPEETSRNRHTESGFRETWSRLADHYVVEFPVFISQSETHNPQPLENWIHPCMLSSTSCLVFPCPKRHSQLPQLVSD